VVDCWHDLDNTEYDCWPLDSPNDYNMINCGGLEMSWVLRPPEKVTDGEEFNVTYTVTASDYFYEYAVKNKIFQFSNASEAKRFCDKHDCPANWNRVTSVIAHIKIGHMHAALESKVLVVSAQVCGDDVCEMEENCLTCPADCGACPMSITIKVAIGLPVTLFFGGFILTMVWFQYQKQKMFWDESWIINYKNIMFGKVCYMGFCSTTSLQPVKSNSSVSRTTDVTVCTMVNTTFKQSFIQPAIYDGRTVAVKHIQKKHFTLSKTIRREVKEVRELDHPNLSKFMGGSIEVPYVSIITEYCPKGSLADVLLNEDVPINWGFRLSFATDIARGMAYLHQHKMFHGRLHSRNCVIDDRWVCKISDYGLTAYRKENFEVVSNGFHCEDTYRIYYAPEVLLGSSSNITPAADDQTEGVKLDIMWRPSLPELKAGKADTDCPNRGDYCELIKKCWSHNVTLRPTFEQVKKMLDKMNPHKMEKYSKHLEAIVAERTQDLLQEKQKTDCLLYSMLPKPVADDLRQGRTAEAQSYSNATVYFSDIVGFTELSGSSTPHQVVDFLNQLYTTLSFIIQLVSKIVIMSIALKIQVSGATADLLNTLGGYTLICRGSLNVKGKGEMTTWWLEAKREESSDPLLGSTEFRGVPVPVSN
ncbi:unnamed protein product, partial [Coregonus sp. 'balchen']